MMSKNLILLSAAAAALATLPPGTLVTLSSPDTITLADGQEERDAILLECCDLPDKKLLLTEQELDNIAARFTGDVPIKLQHMDSPLDPFGVVKSVRREGKRLFGKISFPPAIAAFIRERGALALSCGLNSAPLSLAEVSLVIKGRIPAATLLSDDDAAELARLRVDNAKHLAELVTARVDSQIQTLKRAGKIVPATEAAARVLLSAVDASAARITLADGGTQTVAEAFAAYLAAQPAVIKLSETAPSEGSGGTEAAAFTPEQQDFLSRTLGVDPAKVAETIKADKAQKAEGFGG